MSVSFGIGFLPPSLRSAAPQSSSVGLVDAHVGGHGTAVCSNPAGSVAICESIATVIAPDPLRAVCAFMKCDPAERMKAFAFPSKKVQGLSGANPDMVYGANSMS